MSGTTQELDRKLVMSKQHSHVRGDRQHLVTSEVKVPQVVVPDRVALPVLTKETTGEELLKNLYEQEE